MHKHCNCECYTPQQEKEEKFATAELLKLLRLASSPNRLRILFLIDRFPHCVRDIELDTGLSQTLISHHLSDLLREGLAEKNRFGMRVNFSLTEKGRIFVEKLKEIKT